MGCKCAPSLRLLQRQVNDRWPGRDKSSDGCCASASHHKQNAKSDHEPDHFGYAHALDIDADLAPGVTVDVLTKLLLADDRTKYVIRNGRLLYPSGTDKPYTGINAHRKHLHLSIKPGATFDMGAWKLPPIPHQEDDLTPDQAKQLADIAKSVAEQADMLAEVNERQKRQGLDLGKLKDKAGIK